LESLPRASFSQFSALLHLSLSSSILAVPAQQQRGVGVPSDDEENSTVAAGFLLLFLLLQRFLLLLLLVESPLLLLSPSSSILVDPARQRRDVEVPSDDGEGEDDWVAGSFLLLLL